MEKDDNKCRIISNSQLLFADTLLKNVKLRKTVIDYLAFWSLFYYLCITI